MFFLRNKCLKVIVAKWVKRSEFDLHVFDFAVFELNQVGTWVSAITEQYYEINEAISQNRGISIHLWAKFAKILQKELQTNWLHWLFEILHVTLFQIFIQKLPKSQKNFLNPIIYICEK